MDIGDPSADGIAAGTIVIAYRGTDAILEADGIGGDAPNGYGLALGSPLGTQAGLAADFYQAVKASVGGADIMVSGHSLGGNPDFRAVSPGNGGNP